MARRKKAVEPKVEEKKEIVVSTDKVTKGVKVEEKVLPKKKSKVASVAEGKPTEGKLYCHGHFTYHDAKEFGTDKRYCKRYLAEKKRK